ncbi:MAG: DUF4838 domain-containing protein [Lachnospiraceae bacterium]|nr:DUF4838 domain-containing protein [Lachnospiraceae bacterium]
MDHLTIRIGKQEQNDTVSFASEELKRYLQAIDNTLSFSVLSFSKADLSKKEILWIGTASFFPSDETEFGESELDDGILISTKKNGGLIAGTNPRSVLIATYRFLKELGVRWIRPGKEGERVPKKKIQSLDVDVKEYASYRNRGICAEGAVSFETVHDMIDYLPKAGLNSWFFEGFEPVMLFRRWYNHKSNPYLESEYKSEEQIREQEAAFIRELKRRGIISHKVGHGWTCEPFGMDSSRRTPLEQTDIPKDTVPFLPLIDGRRQVFQNVPLLTNLCYSKKEVRKRMADAVASYCSAHPDVNVVHFWLADGSNNHCECDSCKKKLPSDWYVLLLNEVDEALTEAGLDTKVAFLIYMDLLWAPEEYRIKNPDRFILMFAPFTRDYGRNYSDFSDADESLPEYRRNRLDFSPSLSCYLARLKSWQRIFKGDSFVFDYHLMYAHFNDPGNEKSAENVFTDMQSLRQIGIDGMISCQLLRGSFPTALPLHMMAEALWNRSADKEEAEKDYFLSAYGEDGLKVRAYLSAVSEMFRIYEGPSHGRGARIEGKLCEDSEKIKALVNGFQDTVSRNLRRNTACSPEWELLSFHGVYVIRLAEALRLTEEKDYEKAKEAVGELIDYLNRNEMKIYRAIDVSRAKMHWMRRLDPEKCKNVDVM